MKWSNETPHPHGSLAGAGPAGSPALTIVLKATFDLGADGVLAPAAEPLPICAADVPLGDDPEGSLRCETDLVPFKPRADILLVGTARVPDRRAVTELTVGLRVGTMAWALQVTGDREWSYGSRLALRPSTSLPAPFIEMPLTYERAYGGVDPATGAVYTPNPVGTGFVAKCTPASLHRRRLPNLTGINDPVRAWDSRARPAGFGCYGRMWMPRAAYAGIDLDTGQPTGPFRFDYYNAAHPELQVEGYLDGAEEIELRHLTPGGRLQFRLPGWAPRVMVVRSPEFRPGDASRIGRERRQEVPVLMNLDTLLILADERRVVLTWRGLTPVEDPLAHEILEVRIAGRAPRPAGAGRGDDELGKSRIHALTETPLEQTAQVVAVDDFESTCRHPVPAESPGAPSAAPPVAAPRNQPSAVPGAAPAAPPLAPPAARRRPVVPEDPLERTRFERQPPAKAGPAESPPAPAVPAPAVPAPAVPAPAVPARPAPSPAAAPPEPAAELDAALHQTRIQPPRVPPEPRPSDEALILGLIELYRRSLEAGDGAAHVRLWAQPPPNLAAELAESSALVESQRVRLSVPRVEVVGGLATAHFRESVELRSRAGGGPVVREFAVLMLLERTRAGEWRILRHDSDWGGL